jgi:hypothetical protein
MAHELIGRRLRNMLMDYLSGSSVLREIENEFDAAGVARRSAPDPPVGGQRRTLVQEYYSSLDFTNPSDVRKFLNVLSIFMRNIERAIESAAGSSDPFGGASYTLNRFKKFNEQLRRDGYVYQQGNIVPVTAAARLTDAKAIAEILDARHIAQQIQRIEASIDEDPALAIGTAKEFLESCFKTILTDLGVNYGKTDDLPQLGRKTFKALKLVPDDIPESAKGAETIKRVLSNLSTVVQGLAELRGPYGTGHGKEGRVKGLAPRHARLAVGAASALVTFLFQTHLETKLAPQASRTAQKTD